MRCLSIHVLDKRKTTCLGDCLHDPRITLGQWVARRDNERPSTSEKVSHNPLTQNLIDFSRVANYISHFPTMRCLFSITTIAAMLCSLASPLLAATCPHTQQSGTCHRKKPVAQAHQCHGEMHMHETAAATDETERPSFNSSSCAENCPMECCVARNVTKTASIADIRFVPPLLVADQNSLAIPVTFISIGFSSHTDRGPPTL